MTSLIILGFVFSGSNKLKEAICYDVINKHYETFIIKSNQMRYIVKCHSTYK